MIWKFVLCFNRCDTLFYQPSGKRLNYDKSARLLLRRGQKRFLQVFACTRACLGGHKGKGQLLATALAKHTDWNALQDIFWAEPNLSRTHRPTDYFSTLWFPYQWSFPCLAYHFTYYGFYRQTGRSFSTFRAEFNTAKAPQQSAG